MSREALNVSTMLLVCLGNLGRFCNFSHLFCLDSVQSLYPLLWRFLPVLDGNVDVFLSRDLDSIITLREVAAVQEFLNSTYVILNHSHAFNLQFE